MADNQQIVPSEKKYVMVGKDQNAKIYYTILNDKNYQLQCPFCNQNWKSSGLSLHVTSCRAKNQEMTNPDEIEANVKEACYQIKTMKNLKHRKVLNREKQMKKKEMEKTSSKKTLKITNIQNNTTVHNNTTIINQFGTSNSNPFTTKDDKDEEIKRLTQENDVLRSEKQQLESKIQELNDCKKEIIILNSKIEKLKTKNVELKSENQNLISKKDNLKVQTKKSNDEIKKLEKKLKKGCDRCKGYSDHIKSLQQKDNIRFLEKKKLEDSVKFFINLPEIVQNGKKKFLNVKNRSNSKEISKSVDFILENLANDSNSVFSYEYNENFTKNEIINHREKLFKTACKILKNVIDLTCIDLWKNLNLDFDNHLKIVTLSKQQVPAEKIEIEPELTSFPGEIKDELMEEITFVDIKKEPEEMYEK